MKKGIVMEIDDVFLTLLTPEGEFLRARRQNQAYEIGEEICFFPAESTRTASFWNPFKQYFITKPVWIVSMVLIIILGSLFPMFRNDKAYAYMSIDVNPSIELGVNEKMEVIELTGFNEEGKKVISQLSNWKKQDVVELTKTILLKMKHDGLLDGNKHIIFSTVRTEEAKKEAEKRLQKNINEIKEAINSQSLEVTIYSGTEKELKKAHELGVTAGTYQANEAPKAKSIEKKNNEDSRPAQQPKAKAKAISPGQAKKPSESNELKSVKPEKKQMIEKSIPPGQAKKMEQKQLNSPEQTKKNDNQREQSRESNGPWWNNKPKPQPQKNLNNHSNGNRKAYPKNNKWQNDHPQNNGQKYHGKYNQTPKQQRPNQNKWKDWQHKNEGKQNHH